MIRRYSPTIVLTVWVLLLIGGVSPSLVRIPGMVALAMALAMMAQAEAYSGRSERRRSDRRQDDAPA